MNARSPKKPYRTQFYPYIEHSSCRLLKRDSEGIAMEERNEDVSEHTNEYVTTDVAVEDADMTKDVAMEVTEDRGMS